jgi:Mg2+/Co2+ transporter CorC
MVDDKFGGAVSLITIEDIKRDIVEEIGDESDTLRGM